MSTALGVSAVRNADGEWEGVDSLTHRKIIASHWQAQGILCGLDVKGTNTLSYTVSAGCAVTSRADTDGCVEAYWPGGTTPEIEANQSASPRIDAVWLQAHNQRDLHDDDNLVVLGVTQGTPASSPAQPTVPDGVTVLAYMQVPAASTDLSGVVRVGEVDYAIPYGAALGLISSIRLNQDTTITAASKTYCKQTINLPTDRTLRLEVIVCASAKGSAGGTDTSKVAEVGGHFRIDGKEVGYLFNSAFHGAWWPSTVTLTTTCGRGQHTVEVELHRGYGVDALVHGGSWPGIVLNIYDEGVKR